MRGREVFKNVNKSNESKDVVSYLQIHGVCKQIFITGVSALLNIVAVMRLYLSEKSNSLLNIL